MGIAEELFRCGIDRFDKPLVVNRDESINGSIKNGPQSSLAASERQLIPRHFRSAQVHFTFDDFVCGFELTLALGDEIHLAITLQTGKDQENVLKNHPPCVLQPPPRALHFNTVD